MGKFTFTDCITCGVEFGIPTVLYEEQQRSGGYHHCPNGHRQGWSKDGCENARLRRQVESAKQQEAYLRDQIESEKRRTAAAKAQLTKHKKRSSAGTCPCCNRTFANMARHMKTQHPDFVTEHGAKVVPIKKGAA